LIGLLEMPRKTKASSQPESGPKPKKQKKVNYIPEGYHTVTPFIMYKGECAKALAWYTKHFDHFKEKYRMPGQNDSIGHCEFMIGDTTIMASDESTWAHMVAPSSKHKPTVGFMIYLENVDAAFKKAVAGGATVITEPKDQFYGDRSGTFADPFGHNWTFATHIKDVSPEEMKEKMAEMMSSSHDKKN